jgi:hypothetical protein
MKVSYPTSTGFKLSLSESQQARGPESLTADVVLCKHLPTAGEPRLDSRQAFSHRHPVQTNFGAHPASYLMRIGGREADVKTPRSYDAKPHLN